MCALGVLLYTGCSKDFLDKQPLGKVLASNFFQTEANANSALTAAYDPLQWGTDVPNAVYFPDFVFGDITSDDAYKGGESPGDQPAFEELSTFNGRVSNVALDGLWEKLYQGVYRSNLVIVNVPTITAMSQASKDKMLGQAKFLRAYYYFYLVRAFGDVPLITTILAPSEYQQAKVAKETVYAQIIKDLTEAAAVLPEKNGYSATDMGRATKGAANGMLARVYLYKADWAHAAAAALTVINSNQYKLDPDYKHIFSMGGWNNSESVFEIQHADATTPGGWARGNEGNLFNVMETTRDNDAPYVGWGFVCPTYSLVNEFEPNDPRMEASLILGDALLDPSNASLLAQINGGAPTVGRADTLAGKVIHNSSTGNATKIHSRKYALTQAPVLNSSSGHSNQRVLRYSDILLMYAEASYHTGDEPTALTYLNMVRARARAGTTIPGTLLDVTASGAALLDAIYHERRVEFALEGLRFFDLVRTGRAAQVFATSEKNVVFKTGTNEVFPIPQKEIDLSGGKIKQNNGY